MITDPMIAAAKGCGKCAPLSCCKMKPTLADIGWTVPEPVPILGMAELGESQPGYSS